MCDDYIRQHMDRAEENRLLPPSRRSRGRCVNRASVNGTACLDRCRMRIEESIMLTSVFTQFASFYLLSGNIDA